MGVACAVVATWPSWRPWRSTVAVCGGVRRAKSQPRLVAHLDDSPSVPASVCDRSLVSRDARTVHEVIEKILAVYGTPDGFSIPTRSRAVVRTSSCTVRAKSTAVPVGAPWRLWRPKLGDNRWISRLCHHVPYTYYPWPVEQPGRPSWPWRYARVGRTGMPRGRG